MTDTINNVPRELLERVLYLMDNYIGTTHTEEDELRAFLSAPSPAGVDGLDGVSERIAKVWIGHAHIDDLIAIGKEVDDAQVTIDRLRGEVAERDAAIEEWSGTAVQNGMECDRLQSENQHLRRGLKGDYDLDAWLEWCAGRDQLAALLQEWRSMFVGGIASGQLLRLREKTDAALAEVKQ